VSNDLLLSFTCLFLGRREYIMLVLISYHDGRVYLPSVYLESFTSLLLGRGRVYLMSVYVFYSSAYKKTKYHVVKVSMCLLLVSCLKEEIYLPTKKVGEQKTSMRNSKIIFSARDYIDRVEH